MFTPNEKQITVSWFKKDIVLEWDQPRGYDSPGEGSYEGHGISIYRTTPWNTRPWKAQIHLEYPSVGNVSAHAEGKTPKAAVGALRVKLKMLFKRLGKEVAISMITL